MFFIGRFTFFIGWFKLFKVGTTPFLKITSLKHAIKLNIITHKHKTSKQISGNKAVDNKDKVLLIFVFGQTFLKQTNVFCVKHFLIMLCL